jgi:hypothetical protein
MTEQQHPLTPPPETVEQWANASALTYRENGTYAQHEYALATAAARWGADQELDACVEWLDREGWSGESRQLRATRRPEPPTLNSIALQMLGTIERDAHYLPEITDTIRKALEQLND